MVTNHFSLLLDWLIATLVYFGYLANYNTQGAFAILFLICSDLLNCLKSLGLKLPLQLFQLQSWTLNCRLIWYWDSLPFNNVVGVQRAAKVNVNSAATLFRGRWVKVYSFIVQDCRCKSKTKDLVKAAFICLLCPFNITIPYRNFIWVTINCCHHNTVLLAAFHKLSCRKRSPLDSLWIHAQSYRLHVKDTHS